jgi:chromosome segregation ATPase
MYPPFADETPGRYPAARVNDPETIEELREALAIARAEALALHDELARGAAENARLAAALERLQARLGVQISMLEDIVTELERQPSGGTEVPAEQQALLDAVAARLRALQQALCALAAGDGRS